MAYALFGLQKIVLTSMLSSISIQQSQRSNEQYKYATDSLSLTQQMSSLQSAQSLELSKYYQLLASTSEDGGVTTDDEEKKEELTEISKELGFGEDLASITRDKINDTIKALESKFEATLDDINREIYVVSTKDSALEMVIKALDTKYTAIEKKLEAYLEAEGSGIERATAKYNGVA